MVFGDTPSIAAACLTRTKSSISSTNGDSPGWATLGRLTVSEETLPIVPGNDNWRVPRHWRFATGISVLGCNLTIGGVHPRIPHLQLKAGSVLSSVTLPPKNDAVLEGSWRIEGRILRMVSPVGRHRAPVQPRALSRDADAWTCPRHADGCGR